MKKYGWANKANAYREQARKESLIIMTIIITVNASILIFYIVKIRKYILIKKQLNEQNGYNEYDITYFRDIPDETNSTPARAMYLINYSNKGLNTIKFNDFLSATLLDLSLKGFIEFEAIDAKYMKIILKRNVQEEQGLTEDERAIYNLLYKTADQDNSTSIKKIQDYARINYDSFLDLPRIIKKSVEQYMSNSGKEIEKNKRILQKMKNTKAAYTVFGIISFIMLAFLPIIWIGAIICCIVLEGIIKKINVLSEDAYREKLEWNGLKKYMQEYSLLKEKTVPDIVLWEKYLVYATAFGISKKVIKQLKVDYPEMFNGTYSNSTYWNVVCMSNGYNSFDTLTSGIDKAYSRATSAYNAAHSSSSSGSGGGGGFSSGGGGRRRRRWLRRSLIKNKNRQMILAILFFTIDFL